MSKAMGAICVLSLAAAALVLPVSAASLASSVAGRILLQVESKGEAWYVHPGTKFRHSLGRPAEAFEVMRSQGVGITNANLERIPFAFTILPPNGADSDLDGLPDDVEEALGTNKDKADSDGDNWSDGHELERGYNPLGPGRLTNDEAFAREHAGKIFLQVEQNGEAWYIDPVSLTKRFLGRPGDAFDVMRSLGLGITNSDLASVSLAAGTESPSNKNPDPSNEVFDCGRAGSSETLAASEAAGACFDERLTACTPSKLRLNLALFAETEYEYEVLGPSGGACRLRYTAVIYPDETSQTEFEGKSMVCSVTITSIEDSEAGEQLSSKNDTCTGELVEAYAKVGL